MKRNTVSAKTTSRAFRLALSLSPFSLPQFEEGYTRTGSPRVILNEKMTAVGILGAVLIIGSAMISEWEPNRKRAGS